MVSKGMKLDISLHAEVHDAICSFLLNKKLDIPLTGFLRLLISYGLDCASENYSLAEASQALFLLNYTAAISENVDLDNITSNNLSFYPGLSKPITIRFNSSDERIIHLTNSDRYFYLMVALVDQFICIEDLELTSVYGYENLD